MEPGPSSPVEWVDQTRFAAARPTKPNGGWPGRAWANNTLGPAAVPKTPPERRRLARRERALGWRAAETPLVRADMSPLGVCFRRGQPNAHRHGRRLRSHGCSVYEVVGGDPLPRSPRVATLGPWPKWQRVRGLVLGLNPPGSPEVRPPRMKQDPAPQRLFAVGPSGPAAVGCAPGPAWARRPAPYPNADPTTQRPRRPTTDRRPPRANHHRSTTNHLHHDDNHHRLPAAPVNSRVADRDRHGRRPRTANSLSAFPFAGRARTTHGPGDDVPSVPSETRCLHLKQPVFGLHPNPGPLLPPPVPPRVGSRGLGHPETPTFSHSEMLLRRWWFGDKPTAKQFPRLRLPSVGCCDGGSPRRTTPPPGVVTSAREPSASLVAVTETRYHAWSMDPVTATGKFPPATTSDERRHEPAGVDRRATAR